MSRLTRWIAFALACGGLAVASFLYALLAISGFVVPPFLLLPLPFHAVALVGALGLARTSTRDRPAWAVAAWTLWLAVSAGTGLVVGFLVHLALGPGFALLPALATAVGAWVAMLGVIGRPLPPAPRFALPAAAVALLVGLIVAWLRVTPAAMVYGAAENLPAPALWVLLADGRDPDARYLHFQRPLLRAVELGRAGAVRALLAHGADPLATEQSGTTLVDEALLRGDRDVAEALLAGGGGTAVTVERVAGAGRLDLVNELLDRGLPAGRAMEAAAAGGAWEVVDALLARGLAPIGVPATVRHADPARVARLLDRGGDPNEREGNRGSGRTALQVAASLGPGWPSRLEIATLLLARGADIEAGPGTALVDAVHRHDAEMVRLLLDAGANPRSGLHNALFDGDETIAHLLLDAGAAPLGSDDLVAAARADSVANVRALLDRGVPVDGVAGIGTPLCHAIDWGTDEVIRLLVARGASPDGACGKGRTVRDAAREHDRSRLLP